MTNMKIIKQVEKIRVRNNRLWMDLLRLAVKTSPEEASRIIQQITVNDSKVAKLMGEIR